MGNRVTMNEDALRESAECGMCRRGFGHAGGALFYRVRIETWAVNAQAIHRQQGLTMVLGGNALLARHMGPDEDMAERVGEPSCLTVCVQCLLKSTSVAHLQEAGSDD